LHFHLHRLLKHSGAAAIPSALRYFGLRLYLRYALGLDNAFEVSLPLSLHLHVLRLLVLADIDFGKLDVFLPAGDLHLRQLRTFDRLLEDKVLSQRHSLLGVLRLLPAHVLLFPLLAPCRVLGTKVVLALRLAKMHATIGLPRAPSLGGFLPQFPLHFLDFEDRPSLLHKQVKLKGELFVLLVGPVYLGRRVTPAGLPLRPERLIDLKVVEGLSLDPVVKPLLPWVGTQVFFELFTLYDPLALEETDFVFLAEGQILAAYFVLDFLEEGEGDLVEGGGLHFFATVPHYLGHNKCNFISRPDSH
jgi:hypothetical protein